MKDWESMLSESFRDFNLRSRAYFLAQFLSPIVINWSPEQLKIRTDYYYNKLQAAEK